MDLFPCVPGGLGLWLLTYLRHEVISVVLIVRGPDDEVQILLSYEQLNKFRNLTIKVPQGRTAMAQSFPPAAMRAIVSEVANLLKQRKETVSVAETVRLRAPSCVT